ncbi:MAG: RnfABCDGE type electron transport complex subunit D [Clostridia bacterium]|nr:RnfABCDGE type electron transport complex subunit D [Clostridia bacterium]
MGMLKVSAPPHISTKDDVSTIMYDVILALMPAMIAGAYLFGYRAIIIVLISVLSSVAFEILWNKALNKQPSTNDLTAVVSGILLGFNMPVTVPLWMPVVGSFFMIIIVKMCFGGLGHNFMNPALAGRAFLMASWPAAMTRFVAPFSRLDIVDVTDAITSATPLSPEFAGNVSAWNLFLGNVGGCIGETSALALLIGGAYLLIRRIITWRIPVCYLATVAVLSALCGADVSVQLLLGGLMLGAIFMATDYTTSPVTPLGQIIYAVGCGVLTCVIRFAGGYPEGVSYSILLMNIATPLIDKLTPPKIYGKRSDKNA